MSAELAAMRAFASGREHLAQELALLDLRIAAVLRQLSPRHRFSGLVISDTEVHELIAGTDPAPPAARSVAAGGPIEKEIVASALASADRGVFLPLLELAVRFGLGRLHERLLVMCLAEQVERKYAKLFGYINDDIAARRPTIGLAIELACGSRDEIVASLREDAPLLRYGLIEVRDAAEPLLRRVLSLDDRVVDYLLQIPYRDPRIIAPRRLEDLEVPEPTVTRMREFFRRHAAPENRDSLNGLIYLHGPSLEGSRRLAAAVCSESGVPLIGVDARTLPERAEALEAVVMRLLRDAILADAALCFDNCEAIGGAEPGRLQRIVELTRGRLVFLTGLVPWNTKCELGGRLFADIELPCPPQAMRAASWRRHLAATPLRETDTARLAARFRFTPEQIESVANEAASRVAWVATGNACIDAPLLQKICRTHSAPRLNALAQRISARSRWDDLVVPVDAAGQLRELCTHALYRDVVFGEWGFESRMRLGRGLNALFCGPPGAGKTLAAEVIASELEADLYRVDLSQVVSKFIGETEKQLRQVFDEAQGSDAILLFDEADALFGKRSEVKDAHDRYANIEVGYLLQRMDEYDGIAILATNMRRSLDDAFTRRLRFVVEFPFPETRERSLIWRAHLARGVPIASTSIWSFSLRSS